MTYVCASMLYVCSCHVGRFLQVNGFESITNVVFTNAGMYDTTYATMIAMNIPLKFVDAVFKLPVFWVLLLFFRVVCFRTFDDDSVLACCGRISYISWQAVLFVDESRISSFVLERFVFLFRLYISIAIGIYSIKATTIVHHTHRSWEPKVHVLKRCIFVITYPAYRTSQVETLLSAINILNCGDERYGNTENNGRNQNYKKCDSSQEKGKLFSMWLDDHSISLYRYC